jgi:S23 ribosomal protein.
MPRKFSFKSTSLYSKNHCEIIIRSSLYKYPKIEQYALCDQIRRAVISIPSNIAEGSSRKSDKEKIHFIEIAYGSLLEVYCQVLISKDLEYVTEEDFNSIKEQVHKITRMLSGLKSSIENNLHQNKTSEKL